MIKRTYFFGARYYFDDKGSYKTITGNKVVKSLLPITAERLVDEVLISLSNYHETDKSNIEITCISRIT